MANASILIALLLNLLYTRTTVVIHGQTVTPSDENANECGVTTNYYTDATNRLMTNGEETLPGQWPWLVGLFVLINEEKIGFQCGGSILTTKHVITAGHCLKSNTVDNNNIDPDNLYVAFGHFSLHQWNRRGINREVANYKIHPNYTHWYGNADSNLAILTLRTPVEYSPFVKPICLWSGSTDLQNVVNRIGYVVGWGQDAINVKHEEPRTIRVPIVSEEDCLQSDPRFLRLTSSNTFCAGTQNSSGLCNGSIGSGLMLYDAPTGRYQIRGIVSKALVNNKLQCDFTKFIVYVDVAKYVPWIQQQIFAA